MYESHNALKQFKIHSKKQWEGDGVGSLTQDRVEVGGRTIVPESWGREQSCLSFSAALAIPANSVVWKPELKFKDHRQKGPWANGTHSIREMQGWLGLVIAIAHQ